MTNVSAVEKMAELMQQMEENSPRVAALQCCLKQVAEKVEEAEKRNAELEAKCAALAAELRAVEEIHNEALFITDDHYEQCPPKVQKIIRSLAVMQIPAYHAFLAEVRAQGVEMFARKCDLKAAQSLASDVSDNWKLLGLHASYFAAQLRKGVQS